MRNRLATLVSTLALAVFIAASAPAQESGGAATNPEQPKVQEAAKKAYQAIADSKLDDLWVLVQKKYDRKLRPEKLRQPETGPKLEVSFDGNVKVLRVDKKTAVVVATFFKPQSSDTPATEAQELRLFMVNDHGDWKIGAPDRKEAAFDGDKGGWYHSGSFTFCPNRGMVFLGNHFSSQTECASTAVCRAF